MATRFRAVSVVVAPSRQTWSRRSPEAARTRTRIQALDGPWAVWGGLSVAGALGLWSEKTPVGRELSAALVSTLIGLAMSNSGLIPVDAAEYATVNSYLLPLAIPLLLLSADLNKVLRDTGKLLPVFLAGSVATLIGTFLALKLFPLSSLGENGWKLAAALCARHIGGAVNYVAVTVATGAEQAAVSAGLAADNLMCAVYFTSLYALARKIPPDTEESKVPGSEQESASTPGFDVLYGMSALALSSCLCFAGSSVASYMGQPSLSICIITGLTVILATAAPALLRPLEASASVLAAVLLQVFFAAVGANGSISQVVSSAPALFAFAFVQVFTHLGLLMAAGKAMGWARRDVLLASNANVGGPTTAAGMAVAKGWQMSVVPSILIGTLGYAIATFIGIALGPTLRRMSLGV